ncbi:hypothetical protein DL766_002550 [Monosporascus sp. MC13-8B]|uniref:FAD-binding PCMH-type domain-containing protein n=1 Tax=Monosporascus cannonballus TaxID=155416 RepID=A0ABY0GVS9_9PEZI|nr:hypothetical protein DL762_010001 [Monosporascus cannonballus]RYP35374.1 hypothetical protein DL766_002550 [Monosporascus sp. MC13-8B]
MAQVQVPVEDILAMNPLPGLTPNQSLMPAAGACVRLSQTFTNNSTFTPQDDLYTDLIQASWSHTTWLEPACIFVPRTVDDLQTSVPILAEEDVKFAIRSGGHMPVTGAANADNGVMIDMSSFTQIEYNAENDHVVVGTGLRWQNVYEYLDQYEVTVVGGRVLDIGVGGLILGGIVTAFTLKTYPIHQVWGGTRIIGWDKVDDFLDTMLEYEASTERDPYASVNINLAATNETTLGIILTLVYLKPVEKPTAFSLFDRFEPLVDTTGIRTLTEVMSEFPTAALPRIRFLAMTVEPTKELTAVIKDVMLNSPHMNTIRSTTAGTCLFSWQPISPNLVEAGQRSGGNTLGLEAVPQSWFHIDLLWWNSEDGEAMRIAGESMYAEIEAAAKEQGSHMRYIFMNDANERQPVMASYGPRNVQKMRQVRKQYDPKQLRILARDMGIVGVDKPGVDKSNIYGGIHTGSWVDLLPASWIPYIQLCRLNPPAPLFPVFFPHQYGVTYASILQNASGSEFLRMCLYLLGSSLIVSNAAHSRNDIVDALIDKVISRTKKRPIARGAITPRAALLFMTTQAVGTAASLPALLPATVPTIVGTVYYPYAKRQTPFPQLILGFCLAWGATVGIAAMGVDPLASCVGPYLVAACTIGTVIYGTVYACLDVKDDKKLKLGSTEVLLGSHVKLVLSLLLTSNDRMPGGRRLLAHARDALLRRHAWRLRRVVGCHDRLPRSGD